ncbi:MAG TPA: ABC transporter substrate-binding protein [Promineifilum sp.]|nr:ABC transporter substrate-binding protein [Promineifilum sp.]HRO89867.1 ABC transporter substrate-binding protein [Promineifilum sp.]HRQ13458.1 ABC transporter substrate-binding protein [Promineifilum sp.]
MTRLLLLFMLLGGSLIACRQDVGPTQPAATNQPETISESTPELPENTPVETPNATATAEPTATLTPTPIPPKDLVVCVGAEPTDIYLYGDQSPAAMAIRQAIYEPPYSTLNYDYQPVALDKIPTPGDGDAVIETVEVSEGTVIYNANEEIGPLTKGMTVINANGERVTFSGEPIRMNQMTVDFTFKPLVWSDGTPVTAEDSVFSFHVIGDPNTQLLDKRVRLTKSYKATGERSVRWVGIPGYMEPEYVTHVWTPLPSHQLADFTALEMATLDETTRQPLSYGAFMVESWEEGESVRLVPNPNYYRSAEGLPYLTSLTYKFLSGNNKTLPDGFEGCNIITDDVLSFDAVGAVDDAEAAGTLVEHVATAGVVEQIIFGVDPAAAYESANEVWFQDARVRQAFTQCTDRQAIVDELTFGRAAVMDTFVPNDHVLHPNDVAQWEYDPAAANALLDEVGYRDTDGDGVRSDISSTAPFSITIGTNIDSDLRLQIIEMVADDLAECGIQANPRALEAGTWFAPGPGGKVFGRQFDMAQFAWLSRIQPDCGLYLTQNIPGPMIDGFNGWQGVNVSGWSNEAYDAACNEALAMLPGMPGFVEAHQEAMRIFAQELPAMPLFTRMRLAATTPDVLNFQLDPTQTPSLWNAFELDMKLGGS